MTDLETQLTDSMRTLDTHHAMSGPALRRKARARRLTVRAGGLAVVGATGAAAALVVPGLLTSQPQTAVNGAPGSSTPTPKPLVAASATAITTSSPTVTAAAPVASATPVPPSTSAVPVQAFVWSPAGSLIDDPTVLAAAPRAASTDGDWESWSKDWNEGPLLARDTVSVVFAARSPIDSTSATYPRPLVIVTGRTSADSPTLRIAALTTVGGGADALNLNALTMDAQTVAPSGEQAIAVSTGMSVYVVAEHGVDSATYTYTDGSGTHTATMTVKDGVATALTPMEALKSSANGKITHVRATSQGKVVWDAAPVAGR